MRFEACGSLQHSLVFRLEKVLSKRGQGVRQLCYPPIGGITAVLPHRGISDGTRSVTPESDFALRKGEFTSGGKRLAGSPSIPRAPVEPSISRVVPGRIFFDRPAELELRSTEQEEEP